MQERQLIGRKMSNFHVISFTHPDLIQTNKITSVTALCTGPEALRLMLTELHWVLHAHH